MLNSIITKNWYFVFCNIYKILWHAKQSNYFLLIKRQYFREAVSYLIASLHLSLSSFFPLFQLSNFSILNLLTDFRQYGVAYQINLILFNYAFFTILFIWSDLYESYINPIKACMNFKINKNLMGFSFPVVNLNNQWIHSIILI